jgi:hypothetical protein
MRSIAVLKREIRRRAK